MSCNKGGMGTFLFGGIVGAALGVLFAPAPGTETRAFLREKAQAYLDNADVINDSVRDRAVELYSTASGYAGDASDQLREKIEAARVRLADAVGSAADAAAETVAEGAVTVEAAAESVAAEAAAEAPAEA